MVRLSGARTPPLSATVRLARHRSSGPLEQVARRLSGAILVLLSTVLIVYFGREGYYDNADENVDLLDSFYYATVTLSTTGYGDLVPRSDGARLVNITIITALRILFLIILVGTTLEALTERTREEWRLTRWRSNLRHHTVLVGYGTKGRSALQSLCAAGLKSDKVIIIDSSPAATEAANADGYAAVTGDATRSEVLLHAELHKAKQVIIATQRDDTAALVALSARQLNRTAKIIAAVREEENASLLRQSGANSVITSASAAGRLLGLSCLSPGASAVMDDLIQRGSGLDLIERPTAKSEVGKGAREVEDGIVISVLRGHRLISYDQPEASSLQAEDRLITIARAKSIDSARGEDRAHPFSLL
ncbi:TrkA family potassium uptake protein [Streptomyces sp. IB201691-2A2]|uniref:potassium channel family protein n=1 Tax=Streptomyces sp. IB201691-2A2 TaxID=2561920 RepID=UPI00117C8A89|nr:potassium channel protein [Streptomyces sp. IB201691-2A2]